MEKKYNEIHIMMGLPGSGKTHFVNNNFSDSFFKVNLDDWKEISRLHTALRYNIYNRYCTFAVIDGLILCKDDLSKVINQCSDTVDDNTKFIIHVWNEDREACKNNDKYRMMYDNRNVASQITIENAKYDVDIDVEDINNIFVELEFNCSPMVSIERHDVHSVDFVEGILNKYSYGNKYICSETWCGGGTWGNCWGNSGEVEPDPVPQFELFDELLTEICPNITFLQYKKLYNSCVTTEESDEYDYYGGHTTQFHYRCNKEKLYEMLNEMNLIEEKF